MGLANGLIFLGDPKASHTAVFWMLGGLGLATWDMLAWPLIILVGASIWFLSISNTLNAIMVGDETALTLGISPRKNRIYVFIVSSLITGIMVAFSGIIGFVGLIIPHISRLIIGGNNVKVIPASMLIGAIFLVWADILARTLIQPEDLPIGIITGLVGGGFFLWLLNRSQEH
jgi:iron complex transport system permease protein